MKAFRYGRTNIGRWGGYVAMFGVGLLLANVSNEGWASRTPPTTMLYRWRGLTGTAFLIWMLKLLSLRGREFLIWSKRKKSQ